MYNIRIILYIKNRNHNKKNNQKSLFVEVSINRLNYNLKKFPFYSNIVDRIMIPKYLIQLYLLNFLFAICLAFSPNKISYLSRKNTQIFVIRSNTYI